MPASRTIRRSLMVPVLLGVLSACTAMQRQRAADIALFPVNVVPDILSNTLVLLAIPVWVPLSGKECGLWPMMWLFAPFMGPAVGVMDAWHRYPFWDPGVLDEHRSYEPSAPAPAGRRDGVGQ